MRSGAGRVFLRPAESKDLRLSFWRKVGCHRLASGQIDQAQLLLQRSLNRPCHLRRIRRDVGLKPRHRLAAAIEEKLGEVPLDVAADGRVRRLVGQKYIERRLVVAQHQQF